MNGSNKCDVTVILNCHNEDSYIEATMRSLKECVDYATHRGVSVEIVVILDNPTKFLKNYFKNNSHLDGVISKVIEVHNYSLGVSRNDGVKQSAGKYIVTADADDLISRNFIYCGYKKAEDIFERTGRDCCLIPEFVYVFGDVKIITKFVSSDYFSPCDMVNFHPFCSRILIKRDLLERFSYRDLNKKSGFAFEDWDLNRRLYQNGVLIDVVPETVLFYRRRDNSIMSSSDYIKLPPYCSLMNPGNFLKIYESYSRPKDFNIVSSADSSSFFESESICMFLNDANRLDPSVDIGRNKFNCEYSRNTDAIVSHYGYRLPLLFLLVGVMQFDDVVILPRLESGGGEKYIIQIIESILSIDENRRIVVLVVEKNSHNRWRCKLPKGVIFLNFYAFAKDLSEQDYLTLLMNFILCVSKEGSNLHLKSGYVEYSLMRRYGLSLSHRFNVYKYLFSIEFKNIGGRWYLHSGEVNRLRDDCKIVKRFISDNRKFPGYLSEIFGCYKKELFDVTIHAYQKLECSEARHYRQVTKRVCWASRICKEKRPDILLAIAGKLDNKLGGVVIDVYGKIENGISVPKGRNIKYRGGFESISEINFDQYDLFIYTSMVDGIPNILLEVMAFGVPVVAPVGKRSAIDEIVTLDTAWPVIDHEDDEILVDSYVNQIQSIYKNKEEVILRTNNAKKMLREKFSKISQQEQVRSIFCENLSQDGGVDIGYVNSYIYTLLKELPKVISSNPYFKYFEPKLVSNMSVSSKELIDLSNKVEREIRIRKEFIVMIADLLRPYPFLFRFGKRIYRYPTVQSILRRCIRRS